MEIEENLSGLSALSRLISSDNTIDTHLQINPTTSLTKI